MELFTEDGRKAFEYLGHFTIDQYIREVMMSKSRMSQYYEWNGTTLIYKKKLPKNYVKPEYKHLRFIHPHHLKPGLKCAVILGSTMIGVLDHYSDIKPLLEDEKYKDAKIRIYDTINKEYIVANPDTAGTPNMININGQHIYSGKVADFSKNRVIEAIKQNAKKYLLSALDSTIKPMMLDDYPVLIVFELVDTVINRVGKSKETLSLAQKWDLDNRLYPYEKAILDMLTKKDVLLDDERLCVSGIMKLFTPLEGNDDTNRKLNIIIYKDMRGCVRNNQGYMDFRLGKIKAEKGVPKKKTTKKKAEPLTLDFGSSESLV